MDGAQVRILEEPHQVRLGRLLQGQHRRGLPSDMETRRRV
jgi:hypothetical protein